MRRRKLLSEHEVQEVVTGWTKPRRNETKIQVIIVREQKSIGLCHELSNDSGESQVGRPQQTTLSRLHTKVTQVVIGDGNQGLPLFGKGPQRCGG